MKVDEKTKNGDWREQLSRVFIHNDLVEELKIRKEEYEKKIGYRIDGGVPIVSKICAEVLKHLRLGDKKSIRVEFWKVKGTKTTQFSIE